MEIDKIRRYEPWKVSKSRHTHLYDTSNQGKIFMLIVGGGSFLLVLWILIQTQI